MSPGSVKIEDEKDQKTHLWPRLPLSNDKNAFGHVSNLSSPPGSSNTPLRSSNVSTPAKEGSSSSGSAMGGGDKARLVKHEEHGLMSDKNVMILL